MPQREPDVSRMHLLPALLQKLSPALNLESTATLMILAILVGLGTGFAAVAFIKVIGLATGFSFESGLPHLLSWLGPAWILVVPILGALLSGPMIAYWAVEAKGHGVPEVMQAIVMKGGQIRPRVAVVKSLASSVCIGSGGSAGREGPIVQVGAALGSTAAQLTGLGPDRTITLVACGAAAGIAATFNAPIAGIIFAMEVILGEFTTQYFGTVVIAGVTASVVSRRFLGQEPAFPIPAYTLHSTGELPLYALLGVLSAVAGWLFVGLLYFLEDRFDNWRFPDALKPAVGAIPVGLIGIFFPQALGTGLPVIGRILTSDMGLVFLLTLGVAKLLATSFTLGSGNSGGIFSPSLCMGAALGGAFGQLCHILFPGTAVNPGTYALVGMASVFSAAAHAPLTAFLIVFEMSGDYRMILPLMVTVGLSTLLSQSFRRYSIYTLRLFKRGVPFERDRDVDVMQALKVGEVMTPSPDFVRADLPARDLAENFIRTRHHGYPVLDGKDRLYGVVTVDDLEKATAAGPLEPGARVADICSCDVVVAYPDDPLSKALSHMSERNIGRIPVVDRKNPGRLVGLLRRSDMIHAYRYALHRKLEKQYHNDSILLGRHSETEVLELTLADGMPAAGRRVRDLELPPAALIASVRREDGTVIAHGETRLQPGDKVVVITRPGTADNVRQALQGTVSGSVESAHKEA